MYKVLSYHTFNHTIVYFIRTPPPPSYNILITERTLFKFSLSSQMKTILNTNYTHDSTYTLYAFYTNRIWLVGNVICLVIKS